MSTSKRGAEDAAPDAIELLKADHAQVRALLAEFDAIKGDDDSDERKEELVEQLCAELTLHTMVEEEIFYPAVRAAIDDDDMMDEADVQHAGAKDLVSQLEVMYPGDDHYDATVTVLGEEIEHHIAEEEDEMFRKAKKARIDLHALGRQIRARKQELDDDLAAPPAAVPDLAINSPGRKPMRPPN